MPVAHFPVADPAVGAAVRPAHAAAAATVGRLAITLAGRGGNDLLANTSFQFPATLDGGTNSDRCARGTARDILVSCETIP